MATINNIIRTFQKDGFAGLCRAVWWKLITGPMGTPLSFIQRQIPRRSFTFRKGKLAYFIHPYNCTWANERIIEVPLIRHVLEKYPSSALVLEVGNVMNHYFPFPHDVVDKYEVSRGVMNFDACDFTPRAQYDLIFSISTLEHIGWDAPEKREHGKIERTLRHLKSILAPGGKLVFTVPTGYNSDLDAMLLHRKLPLTEEFYFERYSKRNEWRPTTRDAALALRYGSRFLAANGILFGVLSRDQYLRGSAANA